MVNKALTERERQWLSHLQRARDGEQTLKAYAKAHGLSLSGLYDAAWRLRRAGHWKPGVGKPRREAGAFVPVRIEAGRVSTSFCRLVHISGWTLECTELPPVPWLVALMSHGGSDAAA